MSLTLSSMDARRSAVRNPRQCGYTGNAAGTEDSCTPPEDPLTHPEREPWLPPPTAAHGGSTPRSSGRRKTQTSTPSSATLLPRRYTANARWCIGRTIGLAYLAAHEQDNARPNSRDGAYTQTRKREHPDRSPDSVLRKRSIPDSAQRGARIACNARNLQPVRGRRHVGADCEGNQAKGAFHSVRDASQAASRRGIACKRPLRAS